jgi:quercetin dioxygenase-like cupin family protein
MEIKMFRKIQKASIALITLAAFGSQGEIPINNKGNVPVFEKNPGEKIYELTGRARGTTVKHSVAVVDFAPKAKSVPHIHPVVEESYYVLSGEGELIIGDEKAIVKKGDLVVIPQNKLHQIINNSDILELKLLVTVAEAWTFDCMTFPETK